MELLRTLLFFFVLVLTVRLMGKRQVGEMEPAEFVVALLLAELALIPIETPGVSVWRGLLPIAAVFAAERLLSLVSLRSIRLRRLLCGKPVILVEDGRPVLKNLRRTRVNPDELAAQIRQAGILELRHVQFAILETNGALSVFPFPRYQPASAADAGVDTEALELPYTLISGGRVLADNLEAVGRTRQWLEDCLTQRHCVRSEVALLTATRSGSVFLLRFSDCA